MRRKQITTQTPPGSLPFPGVAVRKGPGRPREFDRSLGLHKALDLFRHRGYEAVSMADLREALQITQASLYAAYGNKESLFREAVALYQAEEGGTTARALHGGRTAKAAIDQMLRDAVQNFSAQPVGSAGCFLVLGAVNCSPGNQGIGEHLKELRLINLQLIEKRIRRGIRDGDVPPIVPVKTVAGFYATILHGLSVQARDGISSNALFGVVDGALGAWDGLVRGNG